MLLLDKVIIIVVFSEKIGTKLETRQWYKCMSDVDLTQWYKAKLPLQYQLPQTTIVVKFLKICFRLT